MTVISAFEIKTTQKKEFFAVPSDALGRTCTLSVKRRLYQVARCMRHMLMRLEPPCIQAVKKEHSAPLTNWRILRRERKSWRELHEPSSPPIIVNLPQLLLCGRAQVPMCIMCAALVHACMSPTRATYIQHRSATRSWRPSWLPWRCVAALTSFVRVNKVRCRRHTWALVGTTPDAQIIRIFVLTRFHCISIWCVLTTSFSWEQNLIL